MGELFCGPGGIGLGAFWASVKRDGREFVIEHAWANDIDRDACNTYARNIAPVTICRDVRKLNFTSLPPIDGLSFGFPCNDFSVVGEQKGIEGTFGPLYKYGVEALKILKPLWFVAENVSGLKNSNEGRAFDQIMAEFKGAGYNVHPQLYKFENYGIPQKRHRIIIIGLRKDLRVQFRIPAPTGNTLTSRQAIEHPPIPIDSANHELTSQAPQVIERLKFIKPGENVFTANMPEYLRLNVRAAKISQIYKRLDPDKPAYTVTGSGGGGTHVYHWSENRALTNRERARLQTFPDDFIFTGTKESVRKQIGMAVPPRIAKIIFESVLTAFAETFCEWSLSERKISARRQHPTDSFETLVGENYAF